MARRITDIVDEGEALGVVAGEVASVPIPVQSVNGETGTVVLTAADVGAATAAQGALADSAVQPGDDAADLGSGAAADGYVLTADGAGGAAWEAPTGGGGAGSYPRAVSARRTSGNITINSTAWTNVDTGLDLTLTGAAVGDQVAYGISAYLGAEAVFLYLDVATVVSGAVVNHFTSSGAAAEGNPAWSGPSGSFTGIGGTTRPYTLVSGDISGGSVTLRLRARTFTATNKVIRATADQVLDVWAINLGPAS